MSGLAGAFNPSGRAIDRVLFDRVCSFVAYRGRDGFTTWHGPGVSMAFAKFVRTPDAAGDRQPRHDAAFGTCVTFDGRLDNREALARELAIDLTDTTCDVALVSAAYAKWGSECPARLLGDFSLVIWDGRERRLFAARDVMALRPLFLREFNGAWWWASDQRALAELDTPAINEAFVAEHLSGRVTTIDETLYEGVQRLPMAHALVIGQTVRRWRYWRPDPGARVTYRDPRDYEYHYRALLVDAVSARLRLHGRAAILMSGGIDSTSVAVQIARLRDEGDAQAAQVQALSMTIPGSVACEEPVIRQVLERVKLPHALLPAEDPPEDYFAGDAARSLDLPQPPSSGQALPLRRAAIAAGRSVLLTGYGGDDWFDTSYAELADELRGGRFLEAARRLKALSSVRHQTAALQLVRIGAWMALPRGVQQGVRRLLRANPVPGWIEPRFAARHHLADRLRQRPDEVEFDTLLQYDTFRAANSGAAAFASDQEERINAALGIEQRHPLMDRRIVEFALAIPAALRCGDGVSKALMRRAMMRELPAAVTQAPANDDFGFLGLRALAHLGGAARVIQSRPVRRGWLRPDVIAGLYGGLEAGATRCLWPLCTTTGVDFWLRALDGNASRGESSRKHGAHAYFEFAN